MTESPGRVVVVGGGVAGLEVARVAATRGHRVHLREAGPALGGAVLTAAAGVGRERLAELVRWLEAECRVLGVDHGLCFHSDDKLRTILWGWAGTALPDSVIEGLQRLSAGMSGELREEMGDLLTTTEVDTLARRIDYLQMYPVYPMPPRGRSPVPWPPL